MAERTYLSIREVLDLLVHEFPDVTISKIRFLESRGLIHPERTPSGYRKFYDADVDRLAWILRQQQEHFLPLKVIKSRLDARRNGASSEPVEASLFDDDCADPPIAPTRLAAPAETNGGLRLMGASDPADDPEPPVAEPTRERIAVHAGGGARHERPESERRGATTVTTRRARGAGGTASDHPSEAPAPPTMVTPAHSSAGEMATSGATSIPPVAPRAVAAAPRRPVAPVIAPTGEDVPVGEAAPAPATAVASPTTESAPAAPAAEAGAPSNGAAPSGRPRRSHAARPAAEAAAPAAVDLGGGMHLSVEELAASAGVAAAIVTELEEYGLIEGREIAGMHCFDEHALVITRVAAGFREYGIEARHLKTFKHAAEREAGLFSQIVTPLLRQRNPAARERANASLSELAELGAAIQAALVQAELRNLTGG